MSMLKKFPKRFAGGILAILIFLLPVMASAATYYVDEVNGNDANSGTAPGAGNAWQTITHAAANVPAGTSGAPNIINVAGGFYDIVNETAFPINFTNDYVSLTGAGSASTTINALAADALVIDATGFSISGFTFQDANTAIDISEGGFAISNNIFDVTVVTGVDFDVSDTGLSAGVFYPDMSITGNTFNTTTYGVHMDVAVGFDYTTENLTASFGNFALTGNTFTLATSDGVYIGDLFYVEEMLNGTITVGDFTATGNTFTGGSDAFYFYSGIDDIEDCQVTVGNTTISNNTFTDQSSDTLQVDYWDVTYVYGSSIVVLGDLTISSNTISADNITYPSCNGIYLSDVGYIEEIYDESTVTTGAINISDNTVNVSDYPLYVYYAYIEYLGEEYWGDTVVVTMGAFNITGNTFTSPDYYGAYIEYYDISYDTYGESQVILGPFTFSNNTVTGDDEALYYYVSYWGEYMYEDSSLVINPVTFTNNTITSTNNMAFYLDIDEAAYYMYGNSSVDIKEITVQNNTLTAGSGEGIYFYLDDYAYEMEDNSVITTAPVTVDNNIINATDGDGIYIKYYDYYVASYMYDNSSATMPDWIITNNTIDVTGGYEGIELYTYENPYENHDNSKAMYGGFLIDGNTFNPNKDAGMDYGIYLYNSEAGYDVYGPSTATFGDITITNNIFYNIDSEAIYIEFYDFGYSFYGAPTLTMGDIEIASNTIDTAGYGVDIYLYDLYTEESGKVTFGELNIHDNTLTNITGYGIYAYYYNYNNDPGSAMLTIGAPTFANNMISGNTAPGDGIYLEVENDTDDITFGMPTLFRNTISGFDHGIYIEDLEEASMSCNYVENNTLAGIRFNNTDGTGFAINNNSIVGNTVGMTIDDGDLAVVDAENNWWGDKAGPAACASCNTVNPGTTGTIDYTPWLTYQPQKSRCGLTFPWVMFTPATTGMGPAVP